MSAEDNLIMRAVAGIMGFAMRHAVIVALALFGAAAYCGYFAATHLGINTDTANMISPELPWRQDFIAYREQFPVRDRNLVVVVDGPDAVAVSDVASRLARRLGEREDLFLDVFLAGEGEFFERNGLLYASVAELERLSDRLVAAQPLIGQIADGLSGAAVLDVAAEAVSRGEADAPGDAEIDALLGGLADTVAAAARGSERPMRWRALIADESDQPARHMILLRPKLDFDRVQPAREAIELVRTLGAELTSGLTSPVDVRMTGTVAMEHEELVSVTRGASAAGLSALVMVAAVLLWALRSITLLVIAVLTLFTGLAVTAAFAALAVGHLNLISVAFAVLYVGLGVDFILHVCLRLKELMAAGHDFDAALVATGRGVGASLVICAVTTAAGFFAFIPTEFDGVSELGLISGSGMFVSLAVSVTLLPAMLSIAWRRRSIRIDPRSVRLNLPRLDFVPPRYIAGIAAVFCAACAFMLPGLVFDSNPIHLRDPASESIAALNELAADSEAPIFNLVAMADGPDVAQDWAARLREQPTVDRVQTVESLVPAEQDEKLYILEDLELVLGPGFASVQEAPFDRAELARAVDGLLAALEARTSPSGAERRLREALEEWRRAVGGLDDSGARASMQSLDAALRSNLAEELQLIERGLGARRFDRGDLPAALSERWVNGSGQELVEIVPSEDLNDNAAAARFVSDVRSVVPNATGLPVVYQEASTTIVRAFGSALSYAIIMVAALLLLLLRRIGDTVLVLIPILFAAIATAGMTVWLGLPLNFANIIALPLLVGVGVDNGIHMVHRMRTEPPRDNRPLNTSTSRAVLASGLTTIASFGNLAFSAHFGMASMGQLLTIGMAVTLVATLVLLPAMLRLRAGR